MKPIIVPKNISPKKAGYFLEETWPWNKKDVEEFPTYPVILKILGFFSSASRAP